MDRFAYHSEPIGKVPKTMEATHHRNERTTRLRGMKDKNGILAERHPNTSPWPQPSQDNLYPDPVPIAAGKKSPDQDRASGQSGESHREVKKRMRVMSNHLDDIYQSFEKYRKHVPELTKLIDHGEREIKRERKAKRSYRKQLKESDRLTDELTAKIAKMKEQRKANADRVKGIEKANRKISKDNDALRDRIDHLQRKIADLQTKEEKMKRNAQHVEEEERQTQPYVKLEPAASEIGHQGQGSGVEVAKVKEERLAVGEGGLVKALERRVIELEKRLLTQRAS